jgi:hypothetical protein
MKAALLLSLAAAIGLAVPAAASARVTNAAGLAADCNADGRVFIRDFLKVTGGSGRLRRDCFVTMAKDATFGLRDVTLTGGDVAFVISDARQSTEVRVGGSTIRLGDNGAIQLSPGCCAGEGEPDRSERRAYIGVSNSFLRAGTVEVSASVADRGGTVLVRDSTLKGVATWSDNPVTVLASLSSINGSVTVLDSTLTGVTGVKIATGDTGDTAARRNTLNFSTAATITTGAGGVCASSGNTPPTPCT